MEKENDIGSLARMMANGFSSMEERFASMQTYMDERFTAIDGRFDTLEKEVRLTNQHIDQIVMPTIDSHARRIKDLELKLV